MNAPICYTRPSITDLEVKYASDAAQYGWGERCYEYIDRFEQAFKRHLDVEFAIATSSATGALHMGMAALGIGPGDEVIMADVNWIATASPVVQLGATPVFVDILHDSWCLDPQYVERAITAKTKAIVAVHLYGNLCDMSALLDIGRRHNIPVIEDAAEAIGSKYNGQAAGSMGAFGAFSFHGTKTMTTGEGGVFVTRDPELYERVLTLSNHGRARNQTRQFWPETVGFKYKMSNIEAAIGCAQLERIKVLVQRKRDILAYYKERLSTYSCLNMNPEPAGHVNGAWMPTVAFDTKAGVDLEALFEAFKRANIDARPFFSPLSSLPFFKSMPQNVEAYERASSAINLPSFHDMTDEHQDRVSDVVESELTRVGIQA